MALTKFHGTKLATGAEDTLIDDPTLSNHSMEIFTDQMVDSDKITIKVYVKDEQAGTMKKLYTFSYEGPMDTSINIFPIQTSDYKVTLTQTATGAGGFKNFNWMRYTQ